MKFFIILKNISRLYFKSLIFWLVLLSVFLILVKLASVLLSLDDTFTFSLLNFVLVSVFVVSIYLQFSKLFKNREEHVKEFQLVWKEAKFSFYLYLVFCSMLFLLAFSVFSYIELKILLPDYSISSLLLSSGLSLILLSFLFVLVSLKINKLLVIFLLLLLVLIEMYLTNTYLLPDMLYLFSNKILINSFLYLFLYAVLYLLLLAFIIRKKHV